MNHFLSWVVIECHGHFLGTLGNEIPVITHSTLSNGRNESNFETLMQDYAITVRIYYNTYNSKVSYFHVMNHLVFVSYKSEHAQGSYVMLHFSTFSCNLTQKRWL